MEIKRTFDVLLEQHRTHPLDVCLAAKNDGNWITYTTEEVVSLINRLSFGLLKTGINAHDKVGLVSFNRPEWVIADFAITQMGGINVPMYPNSTSEDYNFIIKDADVKCIFAGDEEVAQKLEKAIEDLEDKPEIYTFDNLSGQKYWKDILSDGDEKQLENSRSKISYEDLATIIYTSGTTGRPKGVMLSHKNILSNSYSVSKAFPTIEPGSRTLSFLPLCHIFERTALYVYIQKNASIYYAESMETIADNMKEVKPHFFATVPRLLEKIYDKIIAKGYELTGLKKQLFFWAIDLGLKYELNENQGILYRIKLAIANKLIFSKWREALGGNIQFIVSGAAALQPRLARIFWAAKIKVLEAYGLTETSPGVSFTRAEPENARIGCVGPLLENVEVKIAKDGEILVKGPNVMMGYYNRPDATAEVMDEEGWFHTGDVGEMVEDRFLKITDRKKEMFKTSGGKYIAPQYLENKFKESILIEQVIVVGESQKFPAALIVPSFDSLRDWCTKKQITYTSDAQMIDHEKVKKKFEKEIEKLNKGFAQYEKIKQYKILDHQWTIESGELTPTLKLKRKAIHAKYEDEISQLYA